MKSHPWELSPGKGFPIDRLHDRVDPGNDPAATRQAAARLLELLEP